MPRQARRPDPLTSPASEWPFTCLCPTCGYVGWPNATQKRGEPGGTIRWSCPRSQQHDEMTRIRINSFEEVPHAQL